MPTKVIGFDADDTLWVNENYFREGEERFCGLMSSFAREEEVMTELFRVEMQNLPLYGFGIKGFMLSMIETAQLIGGTQVGHHVFDEILEIGKNMLQKPVELLGEVEHVLDTLKPDYRLVLVTKGDLLDQQRKLQSSGLEKYFHHVEVMSDKKEGDYQKLIGHLDIAPSEFLMVGNSLKSDILPVVNIGSKAIYIPYEITWMHEQVDESEIKHEYVQVDKIREILPYL